MLQGILTTLEDLITATYMLEIDNVVNERHNTNLRDLLIKCIDELKLSSLSLRIPYRENNYHMIDMYDLANQWSDKIDKKINDDGILGVTGAGDCRGSVVG